MMKLCKKYLETEGTAIYFLTQASHRKSAIELAVVALRDLPNKPYEILLELTEAMREWTIEAVIQGAWMREYHHWENDTKAYFAAMHVRNASTAPNWRAPGPSHVQKVRAQLNLFAAKESVFLATIDQMRARLNNTKHEGSYLADPQDYEILVEAIVGFWSDLDKQEEVEYSLP